ncbi:hypothetical protein TVAG_128770 [Trichomonas vaginalis G3]|uniref:Uncharacterized protein n=1 Tax=Trichomonas vaginalis (strain ATCC PRA-98 / G3) TaxID=412133 RepID=A2E4C8_TRIV3|nr:hypothetical protein TVAGG3_0018540 [Trichomonas vaginalis G3]EAY12463.1 hypothetical protein TVAG_128770 [Trichomonas vaginalis G3]KAI5539526.1 hypothetical protein TVAGG3_0018540 [Trichomonas vaginalis G3]|eukprot:XP_001324686.1 hypothetical protein [Trichomonas vaginalis G3]
MFFSLLLHVRSEINCCFFESDSSLCSGTADYYYTKTNYSEFSKLDTKSDLQVQIDAIGNINYEIPLDIFNVNSSVVIQGKNFNESIIRLISTPIKNLTLEKMTVIFTNLTDNATIKQHRFNIFMCRIPKMKQLIFDVDVFLKMDLYSATNITKLRYQKVRFYTENFVSEPTTLDLKGLGTSSVVFNWTLPPGNITFYKNLINITLKAYPNKYVIIKNAEDQEIYLHCPFSSNFTFICYQAYNILGAYKITTGFLNGGNVDFPACTWPSYPHLPFYLTGRGKITINCDTAILPANVYTNDGELTLTMKRPDSIISGALTMASKTSIIGNHMLTIQELEFQKKASLTISDKLILNSPRVTMGTDESLYLQGTGFYCFDKIINKRTNLTAQISNFQFSSKGLTIELYRRALTIRISNTGHSESQDLKFYYPDFEYNSSIDTDLCTFEMPGADSLLPSIVRNYTDIIFENSSFLFLEKSTQGIKLRGIRLESDLYSQYCVGFNDTVCPKNSILLTDKNISEWPTQETKWLFKLKFYIDPRYPVENPILNLANFNKGLTVTIDGPIMLDLTSFRMLQNLNAQNSNIFINHPVIAPSMEHMKFKNSTLSLELTRILGKSRYVELDYQTAKIISQKYPSNTYGKTLYLNLEGRNVTIDSEGLYFDDIKLYSPRIRLITDGKPLRIVGNQINMTKTFSLSIEDSPSKLILEGRFDKEFQINITDYCSNIISNTEDIPFYITTNKPNQTINFRSNRNYFIFSSTVDFNGNIKFEIPYDAELSFDELIMSEHTVLTVPEENVNQIYVNNLIINSSFINLSTNEFETTNFTVHQLGSEVYIKRISYYSKFTINYRFRMTQMPFLVIDPSIKLENIIFNFSYDESSLETDMQMIKNNPEMYYEPIPIICGQKINCTNWESKFNNEFFDNYSDTMCSIDEDYGYCYSLVIPERVSHRNKLLLLGFGSVGGVFFIFMVVLLGRYIYDSKKAKQSLSAKSGFSIIP